MNGRPAIGAHMWDEAHRSRFLTLFCLKTQTTFRSRKMIKKWRWQAQSLHKNLFVCSIYESDAYQMAALARQMAA